MESRDVLKIHGKLRRYCTSSVDSGGLKRVKYRNTEYRSLGILTEPNRIIPNRIT